MTKNRYLIRYRRGDIRILDRIGREGISCDCCAVDKATFALILGS
jgi:hypothetical protein